MNRNSSDPHPDVAPAGAATFSTTHWTVVLEAGQGDSPRAADALERLCQAYWYPLYVFVRRRGYSAHDAQDLTQEFFRRFLARNYISIADKTRGKFRTFLLTSLRNFLSDEWDKAHAQKRPRLEPAISWGEVDPEERYGREPTDDLTPDRVYEKRWAWTLLDGVLARLAAEYQAAGRSLEFDQLKKFVWGDENPSPYAVVAEALKVKEGALKVAVHRLKRRFRELLRQEVSHTVSSTQELEEELRYLRSVLSG